MTELSRRTEVLRYRQLVIDTVSSAYPSSVTIAVIIASARIKIVKNVKLEEIENLLDELLIEGILTKDNKRYIFNKKDAGILQNNLTDPSFKDMSDKELRDLQRNETREAKRLRLIQRRVATFLTRQQQFDEDILTLKDVIPDKFTVYTLHSYLPSEWKDDIRRNTSAYLVQCLIYMLHESFVTRCETTGIFFKKKS